MGQWITAFESELSKHSDAPDEFLVGAGYLVAGAALANRIFIRSPDEITTNLYLILMSPPGFFHKSTALRIALRALWRVLPRDKYLLPTNASVEALAKKILLTCKDDEGHAIMVYDEFRSFLAHIRREFAVPIAGLILEKFERGHPWQFARKDRDATDGVETDTIPEGFVLSFSASTTVPYLVEGLKDADITGGMLSRFFLVAADRKTRDFALPVPLDEARLRDFGYMLKVIVDEYPGKVEFGFSHPASKLYVRIYREIERKAMAYGHPDFPSLVSRSPTYVKKLALIHAALSRRGDRMIHADDVETAAELVFRSVRTFEMVLDEAVETDNAWGRAFVKVRKIVTARGRVPKKELLRLCHIRIRDLEEVLESLLRQGRVHIEVDDAGVEYVVWIEP